MKETQELGAEPGELASAPGLMLDLALSLVPRRLALASSLLAVLGGNSRDKVQSLYAEVRKQQAALAPGETRFEAVADVMRRGRDLLAAVAKLENAVLTLSIARARVGASIVPAPIEGACQWM